MKKIGFIILLGGLGLLAMPAAQAQIRELPVAVSDAFSQQYPSADSVSYDDKLIYVLVHFNRQDSSSTARYTPKGVWQSTETAMPFTNLPEMVQDGFNKSKYVGWDVDYTYLVDLPGKVTQYKLLVEKNTVQKRSLIFNTRGRLVSDNITMY